jgi:hypothetical protein
MWSVEFFDESLQNAKPCKRSDQEDIDEGMSKNHDENLNLLKLINIVSLLVQNSLELVKLQQ